MEHTRRRLAMAAAAALVLCIPLQTSALTESFVTTVTRTLNTPDGEFGSCMVALEHSPVDYGLSCPVGRWVALDCAGTLEKTDRLAAMSMFETAQMAFVTKQRVRVWVDDSHKIANWCSLKRLDVY